MIIDTSPLFSPEEIKQHKKDAMIGDAFSPKEIRKRSLRELQRGIDRCSTMGEFYSLVGISRQMLYFWKNESLYGVSARYVIPLVTQLKLSASELRIDLYPPTTY